MRPLKRDRDIGKRGVRCAWKGKFNDIARRKRDPGRAGERASLIGAAGSGKDGGADRRRHAAVNLVDSDGGGTGRARLGDAGAAGQARRIAGGAWRHDAHDDVGGRRRHEHRDVVGIAERLPHRPVAIIRTAAAVPDRARIRRRATRPARSHLDLASLHMQLRLRRRCPDADAARALRRQDDADVGINAVRGDAGLSARRRTAYGELVGG